MNTLKDLYAAHDGKVSDRWTLYLDVYQRVLASMRERPVRMLEIGVQNGGSLEVWSRFFSNAEKLVGCDINPDCERLTYDDPRIQVIVGDANSDEVQARIRSMMPVLDLVIDDGSHVSGDIARSFGRYFPMIADEGIYIAEDLHCSYWKDFEGGLFDATSSIAFFKALADIVNHEHWGRPYARKRLLDPFRARYGFDIEEEQLQHIHSVEFFNSICVVRKRMPSLNLLGPRVVTEGVELVVPGHAVVRGSHADRLDQGDNATASLNAFPAEAIPRLEAQLAQATRELAQQIDRRQALEQEIASIKASRSWRYTSWLRGLGGRLRAGHHG